MYYRDSVHDTATLYSHILWHVPSKGGRRRPARHVVPRVLPVQLKNMNGKAGYSAKVDGGKAQFALTTTKTCTTAPVGAQNWNLAKSQTRRWRHGIVQLSSEQPMTWMVPSSQPAARCQPGPGTFVRLLMAAPATASDCSPSAKLHRCRRPSSPPAATQSPTGDRLQAASGAPHATCRTPSPSPATP